MAESNLPRLRQRPIEVRATPDQGEGAFEAYITKYGVPYSVGWGYKEQIEAGAFDESIAANPVIPIFWMHAWRDGLLIGDAEASTDDVGVKAAGKLWIDDELGLRVWRGMMSGAIREWSIGYYVETITIDKDDDYLEHIDKGELIEGSSVVRGANPETETIEVRVRDALRSIFKVDGNITDERALVDAIRNKLPELLEGRAPKPEEPGDEPAPEIPVERFRLLERPKVREAMRELSK